MIWNSLSKSIAKEYEEFPNDFLNKPNSKAAYLGEGKNVWKKIKHHPYWAVDDLEYFEKLAKRLPHKAWTYHEQSTAKWRLIGVL